MRGDGLIEADERFTVRLTPPGGYGEVSIGSAIILDDDTAANGPSVSVAGTSAFEGSGSQFNYEQPAVAINLSSPATASTEVGYRLVSGTAQVGTDIIVFGDSVTFAENERSRTVLLRTVSDDAVEADEFALFETFIENTMTNNARIAGGGPVDQAIVWVLDDDGSGQPAIGITSPTVVEGDAGRSLAAIKLSLSRPATEAFQIGYSTVANGSAVAGRDFVSTSGSIAVAAGQQEFSFNIEIIGDRAVEGEESFLLSLSPSIFHAGASVSTFTILDGDVAPPKPTQGNDLIDYRGYTTVQTVNGLGGNDVIFGRLVRDILDGNTGNDNIYGEGGNDIIRGGDGFDRLFADGGNDFLAGNGGNDVLAGQNGNDLLIGGSGEDTLYGGLGRDTGSWIDMPGGVSVNLSTGILGGAARGDRLFSIEDLVGTGAIDQLVGDGGANLLAGLGGGDRLYGAAGGDTLDGGSGGDLLAGGQGRDTASYAASSAGVSVNLTTAFAGGGHAAGDRLESIENLRGSAFRDQLVGTGGANRLDGGTGNDRLYGGGGADTLEGGRGADLIAGGSGFDVVSYRGSGAGVGIDLNACTAARGDAEGDTIYNIEGVLGTRFAEVIQGSGTANFLDGGRGGDLLIGLAGNDTLIGAEGNDTLRGDFGADILGGGAGIDAVSYAVSGAGVRVNLSTGAAAGEHAEGNRLFQIESLFGSTLSDVLIGDTGANRLRGSAGADVLTGGRGADVFDFVRGAGIDRVTDFEDRVDRIDLSNHADVNSYFDIDQDIAQVGANLHIVIGTDTMILAGVQRDLVSANDFLT